MIGRLCLLALVLAALASFFIGSSPSVFSSVTLPVGVDELMQLNPD